MPDQTPTLNPNQADVVEEWLTSDIWLWYELVIRDRIDDWQRKVLTGRLDREEYVRACQSIREAEYLLARPKQLIREARMRT